MVSLQLLDHNFLMNHLLALEIVPVSVHTTSGLRPLVQRNGLLAPGDLLP